MTKKYDTVLSKSTLRRVFKKMGFTWRRVKKSLRSKRNQELFDKAKIEIDKLVKAHYDGKLKLFYFDQVGFSLNPSVPYAWQEKGKNIELPSQKGGHLNGIGMITPDNEFKSLIFDGKSDSELMIYCFEHFFKYKRKDQKYVVIIDNAPIHRSDEFQGKIEEWKKRNIEFYFLPPYSPELNIIEIVWRFVKNSWLDFKSYVSKQTLVDGVAEVFKNIGSKYRITFER